MHDEILHQGGRRLRAEMLGDLETLDKIKLPSQPDGTVQVARLKRRPIDL